tara:strand:+ start:1656 stop:1895 length:240 start_codon:yes stop_codon:yes gene_type:complete
MNKAEQINEAAWRVWSSPRKWASVMSIMRQLDSMKSKATETEVTKWLEGQVTKGTMTKRVTMGILPEYLPTQMVVEVAN